MVRTKVFVGNLSFKTQESDLAKEFEVAGKVATANIISRGSRSLGYGFVEFESEEEAKKAVELLNKKQIDSREINVEVARPREENAAKDGNAAPRQPRAPRGPRGPRQAGNNNAGGQGQGQGQGQAQGQGQQGGQGEGGQRQGGRRLQRRPNRPRRPRADGEGGAPNNNQGGQGGAPNNNQGGAPRGQRRGAPRQPRPAGEQRERVPRTASPNTLFVANLPFSVDDSGLAEIFAGLNIKSAHVVRKRNNRSKGFGFVEFNNTDDQTKALAAVDKKSVQDRELIVKVALTEAPGAAPAGDNQNNGAAASPAATPKKDVAAPAAGATGSPKPQQQNAAAATGSPKPQQQNAAAATGSPKPNQS